MSTTRVSYHLSAKRLFTRDPPLLSHSCSFASIRGSNFSFSCGNGSALDLQRASPQLFLQELRSKGSLGFGDLFGWAFGDDLAAVGKNDRPNGDIFLV
jgi:hypothetical protein